MKPGELISGKYRLLRQLGAGGMGSVWAARNELTDRDFAIKFLLPKLATNKEALDRFFLEAKACGQIRHPAVVEVYDVGQADDGSPFLVMEFLEGEGLDQRLARKGPLRPTEAAAAVAFVARGLEEAHKRGLVHRDLKPGNIFFAYDDRGDVIPKVLDFGVSKATLPGGEDMSITSAGAVLGSPAYMSPEQARGDLKIDARSDVWSLGVILFESMTGKAPFDANNYNALMLTILMKPHPPLAEALPGVPAVLAGIVDRALAKDRDARVGTALELAEMLETVVAELEPELLPAQPRVRSVPPPPMAAAAGLTTGPWSESRGAPRLAGAASGPPPAAPALPQKRTSSPLLWMSVGIALAMGAGFTAAAAARAQAPLAAVAQRGALAMSASLARLTAELERLKHEASDPPSAQSASEEVSPPTRASASARTPPAPRPRPGPSRPPKPRDDPHGGVEGPGF